MTVRVLSTIGEPMISSFKSVVLTFRNVSRSLAGASIRSEPTVTYKCDQTSTQYLTSWLVKSSSSASMQRQLRHMMTLLSLPDTNVATVAVRLLQTGNIILSTSANRRKRYTANEPSVFDQLAPVQQPSMPGCWSRANTCIATVIALC